MADPQKIVEIIDAVSIPVMGKARIGHFVEAQILEALGVDMVDESEVLTPADEQFHIDKTGFQSRSSAAPGTSGRRCAGSTRVRR
jgi:pyridoxal 5'-phosphate synthase pdxS subunit